MKSFSSVFLAVCLFPGISFASNWYSSTITDMQCISNSSYCSINLAGSPPSSPACASDQSFAFDSSTTSGDAILKLALSAKAAGWTVSLYGLGSCNVNGFQQDLDYISVD